MSVLRCGMNLLGIKTPETYSNRVQNVVILVAKGNVAFELLQLPKGKKGVLEVKIMPGLFLMVF